MEPAAVVPAPPPPRSARARPGRVRLIWRSVSPLGRSTGALGVVALLLAWRFGWQELAVLGVACLLALVIGVVMLVTGGLDLAVALELGVQRVVVGDPATAKVAATNTARRRQLPVRLETRIGKGTARLAVPSLTPGASHDELFVIPTKRRSIVPVGPVRSVQGDPLGLVRRETTWTGEEDLYVHPKTVPVSSLTTGWMRDLEGETTNDRSPSDVAFHTLREYVVGDDRRHVHWRTTARQPDGKLMVREFVDTRRAHLGLLLSLRSEDYASPDEFELAVSVLGSFGLRAIADEQEVSASVGVRLVPTHYATSFLDALSGLESADDEVDVSTIAARARDAIAGASVAAIITGSRADATDIRLAVERLGQGVRSIVVRAHPGAESTVWTGPPAPMVTLGALEDLPRLMRAVTL